MISVRKHYCAQRCPVTSRCSHALTHRHANMKLSFMLRNRATSVSSGRWPIILPFLQGLSVSHGRLQIVVCRDRFCTSLLSRLYKSSKKKNPTLQIEGTEEHARIARKKESIGQVLNLKQCLNRTSYIDAYPLQWSFSLHSLKQ